MMKVGRTGVITDDPSSMWFKETVPYKRQGESHLLGRWYRTSIQGDWRLEWLDINADKILQQSRNGMAPRFARSRFPTGGR